MKVEAIPDTRPHWDYLLVECECGWRWWGKMLPPIGNSCNACKRSSSEWTAIPVVLVNDEDAA